MIFRKKVGLALGGGGPRGFAHIGVIKVLVENNIPIDYIAGTSIGALIGAFYAAKNNIKELEHFATDLKGTKIISLFLDPTFRQGFVAGNKIIDFIEDFTGQVTFKDLKIPFTAVSTDFVSTKTVFLNTGNVSQAVRASCTIPLVFSPVILENKILVDGGLSMDVPVGAVKKMGADIVIAVNLNKDYPEAKEITKPSYSELAIRSISIIQHYLSEENVKEADVVVCPKAGCIHWKSLMTKEERIKTINLGRTAMEEKLQDLKNIMEGKKTLFNRILDRLHLKI